MPQRHALLVGSMPFENEEDAMSRALDTLGPYLFSLPDGEIGEKTTLYPRGKRLAWTMTVINALAEDKQNWELVKDFNRDADGFPVDYNDMPRLRPRHPASEMHNYLNFGYDRFFRESYAIFNRLREERSLTDVKFQVGIPTGLGITFPAMSRLHALRYADAFNKRLAQEVNTIVKEAGDDVVIQLEVPGEVAMAHMLPKPLVGLSLRSVYALVRRIDPAAQIGVHMCLGDLANKALTHPKSLEKLVHFANAMIKGWPGSHKLIYVHFPLAEGADPPSLDPQYYAPLARAEVPADTRFVAGFVHEKRTEEEHQRILGILDNLRKQPVDVACSCGLGRRPTPVAAQLLDLTSKVAAS